MCFWRQQFQQKIWQWNDLNTNQTKKTEKQVFGPLQRRCEMCFILRFMFHKQISPQHHKNHQLDHKNRPLIHRCCGQRAPHNQRQYPPLYDFPANFISFCQGTWMTLNVFPHLSRQLQLLQLPPLLRTHKLTILTFVQKSSPCIFLNFHPKHQSPKFW